MAQNLTVTAEGDFIASIAGELHSITVTYPQPLPYPPTSIGLTILSRVNASRIGADASQKTADTFTLLWTADAPGLSHVKVEATPLI